MSQHRNYLLRGAAANPREWTLKNRLWIAVRPTSLLAGRGRYDNLVKYIRFQMGCLFGFIVSFLGASIFDITGGVPFLPLQTLWINFTTLLFQAIGLGYGQPAPG